MAAYKISLEEGNVLRVGFGESAGNDQTVIVRDAVTRLCEMVSSNELAGGPLLRIIGAASLPVAIAIGHATAHLYGVIAVFDPELDRYVVAVSHRDAYSPGDLIK